MSESSKEWAVVAVFFVMFLAAIVAEVAWLVVKGWANAARSIAFVFLTDLLSFCLGSLVTFMVVGTMLALAWDGSLPNVPGKEVTMWAALGFAAICPFLLFFFSKRILLGLFKIRTGGPAWAYSIVVTVLIFVFIYLLPALIFYFV